MRCIFIMLCLRLDTGSQGVIGAVYDSKHVMAEIICDGVHIHPAAVRATFEMLGKDRMILISDVCGRQEGRGSYTLGGLDVNVVGNRATLASDGTVAGFGDESYGLHENSG